MLGKIALKYACLVYYVFLVLVRMNMKHPKHHHCVKKLNN